MCQMLMLHHHEKGSIRYLRKLSSPNCFPPFGLRGEVRIYYLKPEKLASDPISGPFRMFTLLIKRL